MFATKEDLKRFATKEDLHRLRGQGRICSTSRPRRICITGATRSRTLKQYPTRAELEAALASLENRMFRLWAASTVTLATLIISMPFVAG